jgi:two-component system, chemotaxis family, sensor kinase CheA
LTSEGGRTMGEPREDLDDESPECMAMRLRELFREEAYELIAELESAVLEIEKSPGDGGQIDRVFRALHTIKGSGAACGLNDIAAFTHEIETFFDLARKGAVAVNRVIIDLTLAACDQIKAMFDVYYREGKADTALGCNIIASFNMIRSTGDDIHAVDNRLEEQHATKSMASPVPEADSSIRVATGKLDDLVNLVGELVTVQARLSQTAGSHGIPEFLVVAEELERLTGSLRDRAMSIRMVPIGSTFSRFNRLVRDLCHELGKEVMLVTAGAETELDKTVIERLGDPLVHLIRNSIDHGIECPDVREAAGKPRMGTISLSAAHSGAFVQIEISDDGAGMDRNAIRARAEERGLLTDGAELSDSELYGLAFTPGFSTAKEVTNVSGRGVGLDVVKRAIDGLRGTIEISNRKGVGTTITLKLPLTLAIINGFLTKINDERYIFPLSLVEECVELTRDTAFAGGRSLLNVRGQVIPYVRLREQFAIDGTPPNIEQVVIARIANNRIGFVVDHVVGDHQTVIKNLGSFYKQVEGISGATIMGDGTVALVLDLPRITALAEHEEARTYC